MTVVPAGGSAPAPQAPVPERAGPGAGREIALVDLLDRVLAGGVVISGEITLRIADVDLVRISLRALVASIRAGWDDAVNREAPPPATDADGRREPA